MNRLIAAAAAYLLGIGLVCLALLPFVTASWMDVAMAGVLFGFLAIGVVALAFVAYPLAKAEADCKRKACEESSET